MTNSLPRITARIDSDTHELLSQAAVIEKAKEIMQRERALKPSQRDAKLLIDALDTPGKTNKSLQQAAKVYQSKTQIQDFSTA